MKNTDKIYGKRRFTLFDQLQKDRIAITLNLLGKNYERLTIVTGVVTENGTPYILIDIPTGFRETFQDNEKGKVLFDFMGKDKILYSFRAVVGRVAENDIWIEFPEFIERVQERKHYRIVPPPGTRIHFAMDAGEYEVNVVDLSLRGALISQSEAPRPQGGASVAKPSETTPKPPGFALRATPRSPHAIPPRASARGILAKASARFQKEVKLSDGEYIKDINLICEEKSLKLQIGIKQAQIRRMVKNSETGGYTYALQFIHIDMREKTELEDWIFKAQREFLRKRNLF